MEIKIPEVGESVREALLAKWFKNSGDFVKRDEALCEIETDKITMDVHADAAGVLSITVAEGTTVPVGSVIGSIAEQPAYALPTGDTESSVSEPASREDRLRSAVSSPSIRREIRERGLDPGSVSGTGKGGRVTPDDLSAGGVNYGRPVSEPLPVQTTLQLKATAAPAPQPMAQTVAAPSAVPPVASVRTEEAPRYNADREERRPMSPIRRRIAEHLVAARQKTAMLTTFNEADLSRVKELRAKYRNHFQMLHGAPLGLMPFFVKACVEALKEFPVVNASIDGDDIVYHNYYDIGIAIGAEKGLVVPILRDADRMHLYEIDQAIAAFSEKIRTNQLSISDIEGGTFSVSNGGVYGSMLSTPILNIPQSGVLGMHAIQDRPVARDGQVVVRPMMYLALSYDHRIIDGREAVGFLKKVRDLIENPEELLLEG